MSETRTYSPSPAEQAEANRTPAPLTVTDIMRGYDDENWLGWGYLGGRDDGHLTPAERDAADALVLDYANAHGWDYEALFTWMNSRPGRHFADDPFATWAPSCLAADLSQ